MGPPQIPLEDLETVAQRLVAGERQTQIAQVKGWTVSRITRCLRHMRDAIVASNGDGAWLDTRQKTPFQVAQEWLRLRERSTPKS